MLEKVCSEDFTFTLSKWNRIIFIPFLLVIGWFGNFMLFRFAQQIKQPSWNLHLKIIAIADSLYLLGLLGKWLEILHFLNLNKMTNCGWNISLLFTSSLISNWILFLHYFDRTMLVMNSNLHQKIFNRKNSLIIAVGLIVVFVVFMGHWPFMLKYDRSKWDISGFPCLFKAKYRLWGSIGWPLFYKFVYILIPFTAILVCAFLMSRSVMKAKQQNIEMKEIDEKALKANMYLACYILFASAPYGLAQMIVTAMNTNEMNCKTYNKWILANVILSNLLFTIYAVKFWILWLANDRVRQNFCSILFNKDVE